MRPATKCRFYVTNCRLKIQEKIKCQNIVITFANAGTVVGKDVILKRELPNASQYRGIFMVLPTRKFMKI